MEDRLTSSSGEEEDSSRAYSVLDLMDELESDEESKGEAQFIEQLARAKERGGSVCILEEQVASIKKKNKVSIDGANVEDNAMTLPTRSPSSKADHAADNKFKSMPRAFNWARKTPKKSDSSGTFYVDLKDQDGTRESLSRERLHSGKKDQSYDRRRSERQTSYTSQATDEELSWGSSEFDSDSEQDETCIKSKSKEDANRRRSSGENMREQFKKFRKKKRHSFTRSRSGEISVLEKLAAKFGNKVDGNELNNDEDEDDMLNVLEVNLNLEKHPEARLPQTPDDLTDQQVKRRYIIGNIAETEQNYRNSLVQLIEDYEKPLLAAKPSILSPKCIKSIFFKVKDILQCHNMFHIELSECVRSWDTDEAIGNIFTASFSKSLVYDVYSSFVNNFAQAMELAKKQARNKPVFAEFLKERVLKSENRLSLFGLLIKPIQRFPQFIMLLQDLLKHTPSHHPDRLALQLALSELESLTHRLNETKRDSESRHQVAELLLSFTGRHSLKMDPRRYLLRQDDMLQIHQTGSETKTKSRRLFLLSDMIICASVHQKGSDNGVLEKYTLKWCASIRDVKIKSHDQVSQLYQLSSGPARNVVISPKLDKPTHSPWRKELEDIKHDLPILEHMSLLSQQLNLQYKGADLNDLQQLTRNLNLAVQQHSNIEQCIIQLSVSSKNNSQENYTYQVMTPTLKQQWLESLFSAQLALDDNKCPGWRIPESESMFPHQMPLFINPLYTSSICHNQVDDIEFALPVLMPHQDDPDVGIQHLWVFSTVDSGPCVSVICFHPASEPKQMETFNILEGRSQGVHVCCAVFVPGFSKIEDEYAFPSDTVWMALSNQVISIHAVFHSNELEEHTPLLVIESDSKVTCLCYLDGRVYAGLDNGTLIVYNRDSEGLWDFKHRMPIILGDLPVSALLPVNHDIWASSGPDLHMVTVTTRYHETGDTGQEIKKVTYKICSNPTDEISNLVIAGVGILITMKGKSLIRVFYLENGEILQDISLQSAVQSVIKESTYKEHQVALESMEVTCLLAAKGLLWIGTNVGCVMTLPLPRLHAIPQMKGRPCVSFHGHRHPVKFLVPIHCGTTNLNADFSMLHDNSDLSVHEATYEDLPSLNEMFNIEGVTQGESDDFLTASQKTDRVLEDEDSGLGNGGLLYGRWKSNPDLFLDRPNVENLYGSLLHDLDIDEIESELLDAPLGLVRRKRVQSDMPGYFHLKFRSSASKHRVSSKYSTLPVLMEDCPVYGRFIAPYGGLDQSPDNNIEMVKSNEASKLQVRYPVIPRSQSKNRKEPLTPKRRTLEDLPEKSDLDVEVKVTSGGRPVSATSDAGYETIQDLQIGEKCNSSVSSLETSKSSSDDFYSSATKHRGVINKAGGRGGSQSSVERAISAPSTLHNINHTSQAVQVISVGNGFINWRLEENKQDERRASCLLRWFCKN